MKCRCPKCNHEFLSKGNDIKILDLLKKKVYQISEICQKLNLSRPAVYHHLERLKKQGLIKTYHIKIESKQLKGNPLFIKLIK